MKYLKTFENHSGTEFIWIHGLPGSGKSTLINQIKSEQPEKNWVVFDDTASVKNVENQMNNGSNIILTSPYFEEYYSMNNYMNRGLVELLRNSNYKVREIWFENDPDACIENVKSRTGHSLDSDSVISVIPQFSRSYIIPPNSETIPVWKSKI